MNIAHSEHVKQSSKQNGGVWSHVFVSLSACILTVAIVGSTVFLIWRIYEHRQLKSRVQKIVSSFQNRTPEELRAHAALLRAKPRLARHVLPEIINSIRNPTSEEQQCAAIQVASAFLDDKRIEKTLFRLRKDYRERVAAAAVVVLADLKPPHRAAGVMGRCLVDARAPAVVDEACAALYRLGEPGRAEMQQRLSGLSVGRRVWLVRFVSAIPDPQRQAWLRMLQSDPEERVRIEATAALDRIVKRADASVDVEASTYVTAGFP